MILLMHLLYFQVLSIFMDLGGVMMNREGSLCEHALLALTSPF